MLGPYLKKKILVFQFQNISPETGIVTTRRLNSPRTSISRKVYSESASAQVSPGYIGPLVNNIQVLVQLNRLRQ